MSFLRSAFPIGDVIHRSRFSLYLENYNYSEPKLYEYVERNKLAYALPLGNLKALITNARTRFPNLSYSLYPINLQQFTKSKYLVYLRHIFVSHKITIDSYILKKIVEYVWMPQEVSISTKDVLYLINGTDIDWIKTYLTLNWDKSREKVEKAVLEKNITSVSIISSAVLIDIFLKNKLIYLDPNKKSYHFNKSVIDLIPKPSLLPPMFDAPSKFQHIALQCKPEELYKIVRNHMGLLGIKEAEEQ